MERPYMSWNEAKAFMMAAFMKVGVPEKDAAICVDVLLESDRRGIESHGINRFKPFYIDRIIKHIQEPITQIEILKDTPTTAVIDGHNGMGMVIAHTAMKMAITKAKQLGLGMVVVRNSTHFGIAGYYATMATEHGLIGMTGTNARPSIAPTFGVENMLGTNPLTFAIPTDEDFPFVLDAATSITQRGRIEYYARNNQETPAGLVIGRDGTPQTHSKQILTDLVSGKAALTPLGGIGEELAGYKGYGYATVVEILSSALQAGSFLHQLSGVAEDGSNKPIPVGHFFLAINPDFFMGLENLKHTTGEILRQLRASKKAPNHDKIYTAGEKEYLTWLERKDKGVPIGDDLQKEFKQVRDQLKLDFVFSFENRSI
ncbi:Ldh family oxidoreductase [Acholeplasma vituli]|uniref:Ldh family oxidoreductase n=1 Tax=Paracholeplasma vituli TaxID=69473 RepID=A0ABT2PUT0_9MOLU|nr:Ldh family oxidoreductase [Paracholeplasma vituli]MCU0104089.1 Ldh family oxidoreductase [Paracholeplasma vituli]